MKMNIAVDVKNVTKNFKLYSDKANTLKERLVRGKKNKTIIRNPLLFNEVIQFISNINNSSF